MKIVLILHKAWVHTATYKMFVFDFQRQIFQDRKYWMQLTNSKDIFSVKFYCFSGYFSLFNPYLQCMLKSAGQEKIIGRRSQEGDFYGYTIKGQRNHVTGTTCLQTPSGASYNYFLDEICIMDMEP